MAVVRQQFPVVRHLFERCDEVPAGPGPGDLSDPRIAVAAAAALALGSAIWGQHVREALGLAGGVGPESAVADLARVIVGWPA